MLKALYILLPCQISQSDTISTSLEVSSHMLQLMRKGCPYTYPPLSLARYFFIQLSELEQCRVKKNLLKVLTPQHRIRSRVFLVESPKLYPWATALYDVSVMSKMKCSKLSLALDTATLNRNSSSVVKLSWQFTRGLYQFSQFSFPYFYFHRAKTDHTIYWTHCQSWLHCWPVHLAGRRALTAGSILTLTWFKFAPRCSNYWYSMYKSSTCCVFWILDTAREQNEINRHDVPNVIAV